MTIIFFLPVIIRDAHRRIFPLEKLEADGNEVIILDATRYFGKYKRTTTDPFLLDHLVECSTQEDFLKFKEALSEDPVLYVTNGSYLRMAKDILERLVRKQDKVLAATTRSFAGLHTYPVGLRKHFENFVKATDHILPWYLLKYYYKIFRGNYIPDYFLGSTNFLLPIKACLTVKPSAQFIVHADDINQVYEPLEHPIEPDKKFGVFLDQMIPYINRRNPGTIPEKIQDSYKREYYERLRVSLEKLKTHFSLDEIVIALHPEAKTLKEEIDKRFDGFRTFENRAHELVRDSSVVFGHFSTVLGFAIFYKKPIILLTDSLINNTFKKGLGSFVTEIDAKVINMEKEITSSMVEDNRNVVKYEEYKRKFIKDNDIQENSFYHAINRIRQEISVK